MEQLNDLELTLLDNLMQKYPSLKTHLPYLKVIDRKLMKTGMIINFEYTNSENELDFEDINALFSDGENIEVKSLKQGLGYVIDITEGKISYLEFVTYGENWNGKFDDYKIIKE